jgi:hypothetical protein
MLLYQTDVVFGFAMCPYCGVIHGDNTDVLETEEDIQRGYTKIHCLCGNEIGLSFNARGCMVAFKLGCL